MITFVDYLRWLDSVLRIGCRGDGDTWRYMRSHFRGLLDELQIYDEPLKPGDIPFLFERPSSTTNSCWVF